MPERKINPASSGPVYSAFRSQGDKLKKLLFKPKIFFEGVAKEQDYKTILIFFVAIFLIIQVVQALVSTLFSLPDFLAQPFGVFLAILSFMFSLLGVAIASLFAFIAPFISSGIYHLGVLTVGGRKGFFNTFKPLTYAMTIGLFYGFISTVLSYILYIVEPLNLENFTLWPGMGFMDVLMLIPTSYYVIFSIIAIISFIHVTYTEVLGLSKFQEMSKARAFAAIMLPFIVIMLILGIIMVALFKFIAMLPAMGAA